MSAFSVLSQRNKCLLINGYIRENDVILAKGLTELILAFYPKINFKFGWHDESIFNVSDSGMIMKPVSDSRCEGWLIYADLNEYNDIGLSSGVYSWSIKSILTQYFIDNPDELREVMDKDVENNSMCYRSIGVTTEKKKIDIHQHATPWEANIYWIESGHHSFFDGTTNGNETMPIWEYGQTMTIILDCNEWTCTYFCDKTEIQKDDIEPNKSYYFAMLCCADIDKTHMQIVDTPDDLIP